MTNVLRMSAADLESIQKRIAASRARMPAAALLIDRMQVDKIVGPHDAGGNCEILMKAAA